MMLLKLLKVRLHWTETSWINLTKITSSVSFSLSLDALAGSGVTDDEETTATTGPDEAVKAGGVMEGLIHGTGCCWDSPSSVLSSHHSADISDHTKMHKHNKKKSAILTVSFDFCIRSNKIIILYIFVSGSPPFFSHKCYRHIALQVLPHHRRSAAKAQESRIRKVL